MAEKIFFRERTVYGLTEEESEVLDSDDEAFFGEINESNVEVRDDSVVSECEEIEEEGILFGNELDKRIQRSVNNQESSPEELGTSSEQPDNSGLISPETDPIFCEISTRLSAGCTCSLSCLSNFTANEVYTFQLSLSEMTKGEKEMLILGKLQVITRSSDNIKHANQTKTGKRQRHTCDYTFDHRRVCKDSFMFLHDIGTKQLKNLQKHLQQHSPVPRQHGLTGRVPATTYPYNVVSDAVHFIRNYAVINGIPQPAARSGRAQNPPIYLPASQNYTIVHSKYREASLAKDPSMRYLQYKSFINVWHQCLPDIVFMTPRSDVCTVCEQFRIQIKDAVQEEDKMKLSADFASHVELAQQEREYYISSMKKAEAELSEVQGRMLPPKYAHYTFDFAEQVHIPHHSRQVGPLYFKVCRKIQIFGICCDSTRKQVNYLIDEDNSIGPNGSKTHGPNSVISMIDHYFNNHALHENECHLHCDNCVGQNKNNYVTGYLCWRIIKAKHQEITLSFMRVGHTRCLVDGHFGLIKKIYRQADTDTLTQMAEVVQRSSLNNLPQLYDWQWQNWVPFLTKYFKRIPNITKYQHFRFSATAPGTVYVRHHWDSEEQAVKMLKKGVTCAQVKKAALPVVIKPAGLTDDRRKYLFQEIRPFVNQRYRDITCPPL